MNPIYRLLTSFSPNSAKTWIRQFDEGHQIVLQMLKKVEQEKIELNQQKYNLECSYDNLLKLYHTVASSHKELLGYSTKRVKVVTHKPVAYDSPDHISPWGTKNDNSTNLRFNYKLAQLISLKNLTVLDLGCSGGGFVKSIVDMGCFAVGIEGSDYSQKMQRAEWATIPEYLFTADITEPFQVLLESMIDNESEEFFKFTVITAWEFIEHISKEKLPTVFKNIASHLKEHGIVIMSVSPNEEVINGLRLHQTVEEKDWWIEECRCNGFEHHENLLTHFGDDYIRGGENAPDSFYLILTRAGEVPLLS